jgi:hypothetical protein
MVITYIIVGIVVFIIYAVCNYQLYKELKRHGIETGAQTSGPGPYTLFRYLIYQKKTEKPLDVKFYISTVAFALFILMLFFPIFILPLVK